MPARAWLDNLPRTLWTWYVGACRRPALPAHRMVQFLGPCVRSWRRRELYVDYTKAWAWTGLKGPLLWGLASPRLTSHTAFCSSCIRWATLPTESVGSDRGTTKSTDETDWGWWSTLWCGINKFLHSCTLLFPSDRMSDEWMSGQEICCAQRITVSHTLVNAQSGFTVERVRRQVSLNCRSHNHNFILKSCYQRGG